MAQITKTDAARVTNVLNRLAADDPAHDFATTRWAFELRLILEKNHGNQFATSLFTVVRGVKEAADRGRTSPPSPRNGRRCRHAV